MCFPKATPCHFRSFGQVAVAANCIRFGEFFESRLRSIDSIVLKEREPFQNVDHTALISMGGLNLSISTKVS
jgi:hypothetical protein